MQRNGLDINQMCRAFSENSTSNGFKNFVKISVSISGNLLDSFAGVFLDFFKSKMEEHVSNKCRRDQVLNSMKPETKKRSKVEVVKDVSVDKVAKLLSKNDTKAVKNVVSDMNAKMKKLAAENKILLHCYQ